MNQPKIFHATDWLLLFAVVFPFDSASAEWKEKVLYSFQGIPDGAYPAGGVVFDQAGNLYGATTDGGANNCPGIEQCGTVFQLQAPAKKGGSWTENLLYVFKGVNSNDGNTPVGGVIFDQAGNLYGTTAYGGSGGCELFGGRVGCGTVYEMVPPKKKGGTWTETVLHSFQSGKDGYFPWGDLTFDKQGNLYGATQYGGGKGTTCDPFYQYCGTVFELSPPKTKGGKWAERVLHSFAGGPDGGNPNGGLAISSVREIYGTTDTGGDVDGMCHRGVGYDGCGTVFILRPPLSKGSNWTEEALYRFKGRPNDGLGPNGGLVSGVGGVLYGTTIGGGTYEDGVAFDLKQPVRNGVWKETLIHVFTGGSDGSSALAGLVSGYDGSLYGTAGGSPSRGGLVFRMKPPERKGGRWIFEVLCDFTGSPDGYDPTQLTLGGSGAIFGTTLYGGVGKACDGGCGTAFTVSP
jgi:hypothetical protein